MARFVLLLVASLVLVLAASCGKPPEAAVPVASTNAVRTQTFQVRGVVIEVKLSRKEIEIKHEAIPDYMPAMTMPFEVRDTNQMTGLAPGDAVAFRLNVTDVEGWIDNIQKLASGPTNPPGSGAFRVLRNVEPLQPGDALPEFHLTNQLGRSFTTAQFKGQALAINFVFTRCPFPTFCPKLTSSFIEVQQKLAQLSNGPTNWHLLTISFDPEFDTPAVLKAYAEAHDCDPAHWTFATGTVEEVMALAEPFGQNFWRDDTGSISHNLRTVVIDAAGKVRKVFPGNEWTGAQLTAEMVQAAQ